MIERINELKGKYKKKIFNYFSSNLIFIIYVILGVLIGFFLRLNTVGSVWSFKPFLCDLAVVIIIGSFAYLFKPKNQFIYLFSVILFFSILAIINSIYYMFYTSFIYINLIGTLSMLGEVSDSVTSRLELYHFIYLFAPLVFIFFHKHLLKKKNNLYFHNKKIFLKTLLSGVVVIAIVIVTLSGTEISRFVKQWNREYIVQRFGIYTYTINDVIQSLEPKVNTMFGYDEAARTYREFYSNLNKDLSDNKYTDIFKDKNVIFIHAESMQNFLIDLEVNGIEITPKLNKLAKEGLYFSKFYPRISVGTSSDSEFTLTTGLMPSSSGTVFLNYYDRTYEALPALFNDLGYYTFSMHGNNGDYWNRKTMYQSLGYQHFYAEDSYEFSNDKTQDDYVGLGLSDKSFFRQSIEKLLEIKENNEKFMGTIITLSNHSPFDDLEKYPKLDFSITFDKVLDELDENGNNMIEQVTVPYLENTSMGNYLKSAHYADEALGEFFNMILENNLDENTVFIIYGDHEAKLGKGQFDLLYNYDPNIDDIKDVTDPTYIPMGTYEYELLKNTPFIIWTSDKTLSGEISDVMGMYDVLPTVGNMFGFETHYALGNDVFSNNEKIVIFPNGNFLTNKVFYNSLKDEHVLLTNEPIESDYIEKYKEYTEARLDVSKALITHDLIEKVGNVFDENSN